MPNGIVRERLTAPRVRSEKAALRLLTSMRETGSQYVLPRKVWRTATELPSVIAAEAH